MLCFYDTETTGLPNKKFSLAHTTQPHIMQLGAVFTDERGKTLLEFERFIKPEGYKASDIAPEALEAHGITYERVMDTGVPRTNALVDFMDLVNKCGLMVAHNNSFDLKLLDIASLRTFGDTRQAHRKAKHFCTMQAYYSILKLPPTPKMRQYGFGPYKNPSLTEVYQHVFGVPFSGAHDAMADVRAVRDVFFKLPKRPTI